MKAKITLLLALALSFLALLCLPAAAGADGPLGTYRALQAARPDGRTVDVDGLALARDVFVLRFTGRFHLFEPVDGRVHGAVFSGRGAYTLTPTSVVERRHLAARTGAARIDSFSSTFDRAVLLFADDTMTRLLEAGTLSEGAPDPVAAALFEERLAAGAADPEFAIDYHLRLLRQLLNDEGAPPPAGPQGPFYALLYGTRPQRAVLAVDPMGVLDDEGSCLRVEDDDNGGFWYSDHLQTVAAGDHRPPRLVDAQHYAIDSRVARSTDLEGQATLRFQVLAPALRVLPIDLHPSLRLQEAVLLGENGGPIELLQPPAGAAGATALLFPRPLAQGSMVEVRLAYAGDGVLIDDGVGIYQVRARTNWYPSLGFQDRATFDLTFRVPKGNTVIAVGEPVKTAEEGGEVISVWRAERPIAVAGFNYGDFKRYDRREENTGIAIEVYAATGTPDVITEINQYLQDVAGAVDPNAAAAFARSDNPVYVDTYTGPAAIGVSPGQIAESAMADAVNSVQVFTNYFGPLESPRLAITQQSQWSFGQAWPSLVYLPYLAGLSSTLRLELGLLGYAGFVDEVGLHEIAHQWWGHRVGWASYRDQWLSEGFAEFSTALVLELTRGPEAYDRFWERRRLDVLGTSKEVAMPAYAAGPIVLGFRAADDRSPGAVQSLIYSKGGFVLHMLRMAMRDHEARSDERFFAMMKDFANSFAGRSATTEDFKAVVERHMVPELDATRDGKIDWFFDQWVYGTEIPRYETDVAVEKLGKDKYRLTGTLSQSGVSDGFVALVPAYVDFGKGERAQFGRAPFRGNASQRLDLTLDLPKKPKGVVLNARYEVLAFD